MNQNERQVNNNSGDNSVVEVLDASALSSSHSMQMEDDDCTAEISRENESPSHDPELQAVLDPPRLTTAVLDNTASDDHNNNMPVEVGCFAATEDTNVPKKMADELSENDNVEATGLNECDSDTNNRGLNSDFGKVVETCPADEAPVPTQYLEESLDSSRLKMKEELMTVADDVTVPTTNLRDTCVEEPRAGIEQPESSYHEQDSNYLQEQAHQYTIPGPNTEPQLNPAPAPFYEVEARLVVESEGEYGPRPRHTEETVYEATLIRSDSDEGRPYCKRHTRMILLGTLAFITGVAVAIGLTVPPSPPPVPPTSVPTPEPTPAVTLPPPLPIHGISKIRQLGSFFESGCGNDRGSRCWPYVEVNGNTAVVAPLLINPNTGEALDSPAWFQQIHILNKTANGTFETIQVLDVDYQPGHMKLFEDTLAVGANWETLETGAVYMYERNTSGLWNQVQRIVAADSRRDAEFGYHVDVYFDCLVIGAYQDREGKIGSIYIYRQKEAGAWKFEEKIAPPDDNKIENFGMAVSINGNRIAVGDRAYGGNKTSTDPKKGAVWVYNYDTASKNWSQLNGMIRNDDCPAFFGVSLDFTFDYGLLIGCPMADKRAGAVYYYEPSGTGYVFRQKITALDKSPSDKIGMMEQISVYGNVMVVGTDISREGSVYVFLRLNGAWIQVTKIESPADEARKFGTRVALFENNLVVSSWFNAHFYELIEGPSLIGCMASCSNGAIFDYECTICDSRVAIDGDTIAVSRNRESLQILSSNGPTLDHPAAFSIDERFGGIAVSKDAIVVGTQDTNSKRGAITVFQKTSGKWFESDQLTPDPDGYREHFGGSVDIDQKKVVVGAYNYQTNKGSVYVFHLNETSSESTWLQEAKLLPNDLIASGFGQSVSINSNFVAVGDRKYNSTAGAVFVYSYNGTSETWTLFNKTITNSDCDNEFGSSVRLVYDNSLMIGCLGDQNDTGAVYYYTQAVTGDHFILQQKLTPLNGAPNDKFGGPNQISVSGNIMVVGTDKEMNGTVHVFAKVNGAWLQVNTINSPPESRRFGYRVAISGLKVLVASVFNVYSYTLDQCEGA